MIGTTLGRYRIVERLGQGGMGVVYRAEDPRLERQVAIKVLRDDALRGEESRKRFRFEARALSRLMHPHIATLFDLDSDDGVDFLVLEFVAGDTLDEVLASGPLPETRARAIALEVASALEAAHEQGVVHRDLKPRNVILTPRGHAKVLDFGLAHLVPDVGQVSEASTLSGGETLVGTIPYMAPEQIRDGRVDARTDLYALGALIYEMTTGVRPFTAPDTAALLYGIVHDPAPSIRARRPGVSTELERVVAQCLAKSPAQRYSDAAALIRALRGDASGSHDANAGTTAERAETISFRRPAVGMAHPAAAPGAPAAIRSLVVLPFANRSGDPQQEFFADGMTDALIADLAQISALRVISRTSAMRFKGTSTALPDIARELRVDAVVEGSALRAGERVRITVQLIEAASDRSMWAKSYERPLTDILALQSEVARAIADEIRIQVTPEEHGRLGPKGPVNPAAHVAYLQGRFLWNRWNTESLLASIARYQEAIAADPDYARAYAGLADSYSTLGNTNAMPPGEAYPLARAAAQRGLELDPELADLHASLGYVHRFHDWDWPAAERRFLRAIACNPGYATGRRWYAQFLSGMGRHDEAIGEAERALEFDPLSLIIHTAVGDVLFFARRYERAAGYYRRCLEMDSAFGPGHTDLARTLEQLGRHDEALAEFLAAVPRTEGRPEPSSGLAIQLMRAGRKDEAHAMIGELLARSSRQFVSPYGIASFYAVAGDNARALDWLERAYAERDGTLVWIKVHPRLDGLRGEHRFRELLSKMNLEA